MCNKWIESIDVDHSSIPFGKHKGTQVWKLPPDYIRWLLNQPDMKTDKWSDLYSTLSRVLPLLGRDDVEFEIYEPNLNEQPADNYWVMATMDGNNED